MNAIDSSFGSAVSPYAEWGANMKNKRALRIVLIAGAILLPAEIIGVYFFGSHKGSEDAIGNLTAQSDAESVKSESAPPPPAIASPKVISSSVAAVYSEFSGNKLKAEMKYENSVIDLIGMFVKADDSGTGEISMGLTSPGQSSDIVQAVLDKKYISQVADFKVGDLVYVRCGNLDRDYSIPSFNTCISPHLVDLKGDTPEIFYDKILAKEQHNGS